MLFHIVSITLFLRCLKSQFTTMYNLHYFFSCVSIYCVYCHVNLVYWLWYWQLILTLYTGCIYCIFGIQLCVLVSRWANKSKQPHLVDKRKTSCEGIIMVHVQDTGLVKSSNQKQQMQNTWVIQPFQLIFLIPPYLLVKY